MAMPASKPVKPEEYLALERESETKHELVNGEIYAMSGASVAHVKLSRNLMLAIGRRLEGSPCEPFGSDLRLKVSPTGMYTYPDLTVVCGEPKLDDGPFDTLLNPSLIIEVLSPSTELYDRGAKFAHYRHLDSLCAYVLVASEHVLVERFTRTATGEWLLTAFDDLNQTLTLTTLGIDVPLAEIYKGVNVPSGPPSRNPEPSGN